MRSWLLIMIILFTSFARAQDTTSHQSLFWEVSGNGLSSPSYLYGTIHVICKRDVVFTDTVKNKLASCKAIYVETVLNEDSIEMLQNGMSKGRTLKQIIGRSDFKRVQRFFSEDRDMTDSFLNTLNVAKLGNLMLEQKGGCTMTSIDNELENLAKSDGLLIKGLESQEEHSSYIHRPSISEQANYIFALLNNIDRALVRLRNEMDFYLSGNLEKLYRLSAYNPDGSKSDIAINLGDKRNRLWVPRMDSAMKENSCFFAFGCNHLFGENGIINLLRLRGYIVRPLNYY